MELLHIVTPSGAALGALRIGGLVLLALSAAGALYTLLLRRSLARRTSDLRRALEQVRHAMALKDEFLTKVTHELRTPLHGLTGVHDLLMGSSLTAQQRSQLALAQSAAAQLDSLIGSLLDLSAATEGRLFVASEEFDPALTMNCVAGRFAHEAELKGLTLVKEVQGLPCRVMGDPRRLAQILEALLDNAVRFTEEGTIRVQAGAGAPSGGVVELNFRVENPGGPLAPAVREGLFEPFRQAEGGLNRKHQGSGLGLALASNIAAAMGGRLWYDDGFACGVCFRFTIRCGVAAEHAGPRPLRVLLAEDNTLNQLVARRPLEKAGHTVVVASDGHAAVDCYEHQAFDIVLMDMQMPGMDGLEATRKIRQLERELGRRIPIAAVTAHSLQEDLLRYRDAGIDDCLPKPFHAGDLLLLVERLGSAVPTAPVVH